jgi:Xaa-Pro aminopeptidase
MFLTLENHLQAIGMADRLVSAADLVTALRTRKTPVELDRIRLAVDLTEGFFERVPRVVQVGWTERRVFDWLQGEARQIGASTAWDAAQCPLVTTGPQSSVGHGLPSNELTVHPGGILHIDFGIRRQDYCSDLQRCWYVPRDGETAPPAEMQRAFDAVAGAIQAAAAVLKPGVAGWQVDQAARSSLVAAGYPEYQHATGHHVGRAAHDGGGVLGPRWERYGDTPLRKAEPGHVYTLELGIENAGGGGYLGLEEMVVVTSSGCEFLSRPQTRLPLLSAVV